MIIELWPIGVVLQNHGPVTKATREVWLQSAGYLTRCRRVHAGETGGAVDQSKLVVVRALPDIEQGLVWPQLLPKVVWPMANCLRPTGIPQRAFFSGPALEWEPSAQLDPMTSTPGRIIQTDRGRRRLLKDELARGFGLPKQRIEHIRLTNRLLGETTSLHILEYLTLLLLNAPLALKQNEWVSRELEVALGSATAAPLKKMPVYPAFHWVPPDLSEGSQFYNDSVRTLIYASQSFPDPDAVLRDGLQILRIHRGNYTKTHPLLRRLQIIWWEFPPAHWADLKDGSSMNFLKPPGECILPNSDMTPEQLIIAGDFVDELVDLGVLEPKSADKPVVANAPLFTVEKEGQPGQWRVIADMKKGQQNKCIGSDPTVFPRIDVILSQLHSGGFSAVVDCSKFFYQFRTRPEERKYLGVVHPISQICYRYVGMPMGSSASPSLAGKYGNAFIGKLCLECEAFQGHPVLNTWWRSFQGDTPF
jgi:hypothetical protein